MTQRIPLKEEKHYQEVNQPQDGKEIPIFYPKEEKKKERRKKRKRCEARVSDGRTHYMFLPLLGHTVTADLGLTLLLLLQTFQTPSQTQLSFCLPAGFPFLSISSPARSTPFLLPSSWKSFASAWAELKAAERRGGPPTAPQPRLQQVLLLPIYTTSRKKATSLQLGAQRRKKMPLCSNSEVPLVCFFFSLLIAKTKQRCLMAGKSCPVGTLLCYRETKHLYHEESHLEKLH